MNNEEYAWLIPAVEKIGWEAFLLYIESVVAALNKMQPGQTFEIKRLVKPENIELFIKITKGFIAFYPVYYFDNEYTVITRRYGKTN